MTERPPRQSGPKPGQVLVEVVSRGYSGDLSARPWPAEVPFEQRVGELSTAIVRIATQFRTHLDGLAAAAQQESDRWALGEVGLEFAVALGAEGGVIVAKASAETTFRASLTWKRTAESESPE